MKLFHSKTPAFLFIGVIAFLTATCSPALQESPSSIINMEKTDLSESWKRLKNFEEKGLYESAYKLADSILAVAREGAYLADEFKALDHKIQNARIFKEDAEDDIFAELAENATKSSGLRKSLYSAYSASFYLEYFNNHSWEIMQRTPGEYNKGNYKTWSEKEFKQRIDSLYQASLTHEEILKNTATLNALPLLKTDSATISLRPTLYDVFIFNALSFYENEENWSNRISDQKLLNDSLLFGESNDFLNLQFDPAESYTHHALHLYQKLLDFHKENKDRNVLVYINSERLQFAKKECLHPNADPWYIQALQREIENFNSVEESTLFNYLLAMEYQQQAGLYNPPADTLNRWKNKMALEVCEQAISRFPESFGSKQCQLLIAEIKTPTLQFEVEKTIAAETAFKGLLSYQNIEKVFFAIYEIEQSAYKAIKSDYRNPEASKFKKRKALKSWSVNVNDEGDYQEHSLEFKMDALPLGFYILTASDQEELKNDSINFAHAGIEISNLNASYRIINKKAEFLITDRTSGKAVEGATVRLTPGRGGNGGGEQSGVSDKAGIVMLNFSERNGSYNFSVSKGNDRHEFENSIYLYKNNQQTKRQDQEHIFTDRAIYRPGQEVFFKVISVDHGEKDANVVPDKSLTATLYDVNYKKAGSLNLKTNAFGSASGSFALPAAGRTGRMSLEIGNNRISFSVEEYKRPSFEVKVNAPENTYKLGDSIRVSAEAIAYSGASVDNANVKYRVVRQSYFPFWRGFYYPWHPTEDKEIASGNTNTEEDGSFDISFKAIADDMADNNRFPQYFTYRISADVTDIAGETRSGELTVTVGEKSIILNAEIPEEVYKEDLDSISISAQNLNGKKINLPITVQLYKVEISGFPKREALWSAPDQFIIDENEFNELFPYDYYKGEQDPKKLPKQLIESISLEADSSSFVSFKSLKNSDPGMYLIKLLPLEKSSETEEFEKFFTLYSKTSNKPAGNKLFEAKQINSSGSPGEKASILISSALNDQPVRIDVEKEGIITDSKWITLNKEQQVLTFDITESDLRDFAVHVYSNRLNRSFLQTFDVDVIRKERKLDLSLETFRDKLKPGGEETWTLTINDDKQAAEILASMYDASLDAFTSSEWNLNVFQDYYSHFQWNSPGGNIVNASGNNYYGHGFSDPAERLFPQLAFAVFDNYRYRFRGGRDGVLLQSAMAMEENSDQAESASYKFNQADQPPPPQKETKQQEKQESFPVRSDFRETAFFYPQIKTDKEGKIKISFTVPDALTRWKFRALAHTTDLKTGSIVQEVLSSKDLMITANAPRFFREGDLIYYPAKIKNLSDKNLSGSAVMTITDPFTGEEITSSFDPEKTSLDFNVKPGASFPLEWKLKIPEGIGAVLCRITAVSGEFTDGEEIVIPVLPNRMLVTETLPFTIKGKGAHSFTLDKLKNNSSSTLKSEQLVLEFSNNPAWYAVQSMPYLMEYPYDCSEQIFARLFANSLSSYVLNSKPQLRKTIEAWKTSSPDAFLSNLQKNEDLKNILLEETPWLLEAEDESASKRRIALLFDMNRMRHEQEKAISKLIDNQLADGSFPWFKGMSSNRYITQYIVSGLGHLQALKAIDMNDYPQLEEMLNKAIVWMDKEMDEDYNRSTEKGKKPENLSLSHISVQYLYARSFFTEQPFKDKQTESSFNQWLSVSEKQWLSQNLQGQARLASALQRYKKPTAAAIVQSLRERALTKDSYGMYWKEWNNGYNWYESPIETQSLLIETFEAVDASIEETNAMRTWLINQKRTQNWGNTKATSLACYALLLRGTDWLEELPQPEITIGNKSLIFSGDARKNEVFVKSEPGTGYFKTTFHKDEIKPEMATVNINMEQDNLAWGGIYWQYFEDLDKITAADSPLQIRKELYKEEITANGRNLLKITESEVLKQGDKVIVRILIEVSQAMEYIHLKDMRSAGFEPLNVFSGYKFGNGMGYYESTGDVATNFFFDRINRGSYVFEYPLRVAQKGEFSNGISSIQCMYAPEFSSHSAGIGVTVK